MSDHLKNNPFVKYFPSLEAAQRYSKECEPVVEKEIQPEQLKVIDENETFAEPKVPAKYCNLNEKIEDIFGITINKNSKKKIVYLPDIVSDPQQIWMDMELLESALFERLMLPEPKECLLNDDNKPCKFLEKRPIIYLFVCYKKIMTILDSQPNCENVLLNTMVALTIRNMSTALKQPELFEGQDLNQQLTAIFDSCTSVPFYSRFINQLVTEIIKDEDNKEALVESVFKPLLIHVHKIIANCSLSSFGQSNFFEVLMSLAHNNETADLLMKYSTPAATNSGESYCNTILGAILCISCLPKVNEGKYLFFVVGDIDKHIENSVWTATKDINNRLYQLFFQLLKVSPEVKERTLSWIKNCLLLNEARGKIWALYGFHHQLGHGLTSDAFMLNLGAVLLKLCEPIFGSSQKWSKIDPTYGSSEGFKASTCLIPAEEVANRPKSENYSFITEIFFLTHKAIDLGFRVAVEKLTNMNQDLQRLFEARQDVERAGALNSQAAETIISRLKSENTRYLSLRATLLEPVAQELLMKLVVTTSNWLVQVALDTSNEPRTAYTINSVKNLTFPLPEEPPVTLACIPEFFIENINCFLLFSKRFNGDHIEEAGPKGLNDIITLIIVMTRGGNRVKNPHLRAGMMEALETLNPDEEAQNATFRRKVFENHPFYKEIIPSLLDVFVSIEMTGENVQFEMKFKYRRPIYILIECLMNSPQFVRVFEELSSEAERNMEAVTPPIFLRFVNLLINDAVYLLDESLSNMAQLRTMQRARDAGEWNQLPPAEREQKEALFKQTGMIAKFNNILGNYTIDALLKFSGQVKRIFSHPTLVDRVAAMLNYVLVHLVGPKRNTLKVKDHRQYEFRPDTLVKRILHIYHNLSDSNAFCLAVTQDGRSFNEKLFDQAADIADRLGDLELSTLVRTVASRVGELASQHKEKEEMLVDAPDEFLDPIMSTLMLDPVILPTSHVTVDRATIARHLLSDQTDPFNRSPLTMDKVTPNIELKEKILAWIETRKDNKEKTLDDVTSMEED